MDSQKTIRIKDCSSSEVFEIPLTRLAKKAIRRKGERLPENLDRCYGAIPLSEFSPKKGEIFYIYDPASELYWLNKILW